VFLRYGLRLGTAILPDSGHPSGETIRFWDLWNEALRPFKAMGLRIGRGAFGGWEDAEPGLLRALWHLVRQVRPDKIVETGVARGFTARFILEALEENGRGHLWSVDAPPALKPELLGQVGAAVPEPLRHRWSYVRGSSVRRLPGLLTELETIDVFVHDSRHTEKNVRFEMERAWQHLRPGGVLIIDDIDLNGTFVKFTKSVANQQFLVGYAEPLQPDPSRFEGRGLFGIVFKQLRSQDGA
jgi:predicted O-methyltransferase YrrM